MVHKKTEYRLQFHLLSKDLRKQIWQENIKSRELYRSLNRADHYWSYQLTNEKCDCENGEEDEAEAALPPHKLKQKMLLAQYESAKSHNGMHDVPKQHVVSSPSQVQRDIHQLTSPKRNALFGTELALQNVERESQGKRLKNDSSHEIHNLNRSLSTITKPVEKQITEEQRNPAVPSHRSITIKEPSSQPRVSNEERLHDTSTSLGHRSIIQRNPSNISTLTRTTRKAYFKDKRSPFAPFGWNDSVRNIGQKKTYNVYAPESEVYPPALLALKRRRTEIERYLAEEAQRRRQELAPRSKESGVVNDGSIWMTEYREKFTHGNKFRNDHLSKRPSSAPPPRRLAAWRYS